MTEKLQVQAERCRHWLVEHALPLWATHGFNSEQRLFQEGLLTPNEPFSDDISRFRVQPRQLYVFAHATELGWFNGGHLIKQALTGFDHFLDHSSGYVFSIDSELKIKDGSVNTYEQAFALLGYAWHYKLNQDPLSLHKAEAGYQWLQQALADKQLGGFFSSLTVSDLRSQNPHMHLFEALMSWYDVTHDSLWLDRASELYQLFNQRFLECHFLREFFALDFTATHPLSDNLDPGHHYEWIWLLFHYHQLTGVDVSAQIEILLNFVQQYGHSALGLVMDEIKTDGQAHRNTSRLWGQTELIKGRLALYEITPSEYNQQQLIEAIERVFRYYLDPTFAGLWIDQINCDGKPLVIKSPASTLYHLFLAFSEVYRVASLPPFKR